MDDKEEERQIDTMEENQCDNSKELMIRMDRRMEMIEKKQASISKKLDKLIGLLSDPDGGLKAAVKEEVEADFVVGLTLILILIE